MPPRGGTFLAQGDLKVPCEFNNTTGFSALTIRSSRARFAASALAGYDLTIANAAQRPGLAQALGGIQPVGQFDESARASSTLSRFRLDGLASVPSFSD